MYLHDILKRLSAKICFDASFMCLGRFVAFRVTLTTYAVAYCHARLEITDQSWHTGPNESVLRFEVVLVVCYNQIWKLVKIVL